MMTHMIERAPRVSTTLGPQRGMALVLVLWLVVLLSLLATGHARNARNETHLAAAYVDNSTARALVEAGVNRAILDLLSPGDAQQWIVDGTVHSFDLNGYAIDVAIRDATGLVDLNTASSGVLTALISSVEPDDELRQRIVDAILDWRDRDDLTHLNGAEGRDYRAAGMAWTPRDDRFTSVDELLYVMGMTRAIFDRVAPCLTVYSGRSGVNLEYAPPFLITALTGQEMEADAEHSGPRAPAGSPSRRGTFHIYVSASVGERATASAETVVRLSYDAEHPYVTLYWRETMRTPFSATERSAT